MSKFIHFLVHFFCSRQWIKKQGGHCHLSFRITSKLDGFIDITRKVHILAKSKIRRQSIGKDRHTRSNSKADFKSSRLADISVRAHKPEKA